MPDISLNYLLTGQDKSASKTMQATATAGQKAGQAIGNSFKSLGSTIGGEVGELLTRVGEGIDKVAEHGLTASQKLGAAGVGITGLGTAMMAFGSASKAADQQLEVAFSNAGSSTEEYKDQIDDLVNSMALLGHSDDETKNSLQTLTTAIGDPKKALNDMALVADYAAAKHISLQAAADALAKALSGGSTRAFTAMGVVVEQNADGTKNLDKATSELAAKLDGQASAAASTFTGWVKGLYTEVENAAQEFSAEWGPAITVVGAGLTTLSAILQIVSAVQARRAAASEAAALAEAQNATTTTAASEALSAETVALIENTTAKGANAAASTRAAAAAAGLGSRVGTAASTVANFVPLLGVAVVGADLMNAATNGLTNAVTNNGAAMGNAEVDVESWSEALKDGKVSAAALVQNAATASNGIYDFADAIGAGSDAQNRMIESTKNADEALSHLPTDQLKAQWDAVSESWKDSHGSLDGLTDAFPLSAAAYQAAMSGDAAANDGVASSATEAADALTKQADALRNLGSVEETTRDKNRAFHQSLLEVTDGLNQQRQQAIEQQKAAYEAATGSLDGWSDAMASFTPSLDLNTTAGIQNEAALDRVAQSTKDLAAQTLEQTNDQFAANEVMANGYTQLINLLGQFHITGQAAVDYATNLGLIPHYVATTATLDTAPAQAALDSFVDRNTGRSIVVGISSNSATGQAILNNIAFRADGGTIGGYAGGGTIAAALNALAGVRGMASAGTVIGGGTGTSDTATRVPTWLAIGEEVTRAYSASYPGVRPVLKAINADPAGSMRQLSNLAAAASPQSTPTTVQVPVPTPSLTEDDMDRLASKIGRELGRALRKQGTAVTI